MINMITALKKLLSIGIVVSVVLSLGCTTANEKIGGALNLDTDLKLEFVVDKNVNPDESEKASPVYLRMYELTNTQSFENADFIDIYEQDEKILGKALLGKRKLKRFVPGEVRTESFVLNKKTRYVALYGEFFKFRDSRYKVVFPVTASNLIRNKVKISVSENNIVILEE